MLDCAKKWNGKDRIQREIKAGESLILFNHFIQNDKEFEGSTFLAHFLMQNEEGTLIGEQKTNKFRRNF